MDFQHFAPQIDKIPKLKPKQVASIAFWNTVRENFTISTWIAMGAVAQGLLLLFARPTFAVAPAAVFLLFRFSRTMLMHWGFIPNTQMQDVLMGKYTVQVPNEDGSPPSEVADKGVAVIMLGVRNNHALGMFGSGAKEISQFFTAMMRNLHDDKESGFLGASYYRSANERLTSNGFMTCCYFRSVEDIHRFAHSPVHREGWNWWNKITDTHPHLSIMHEIYDAPKKQWENIFINFHLTGIGKMARPVTVNGREYTPIANAARGPLSTHKGRLGKLGQGSLEKEYLAHAY